MQIEYQTQQSEGEKRVEEEEEEEAHRTSDEKPWRHTGQEASRTLYI